MAMTLLRRHTGQQPALGARLERTHPLTQGLQHLWMGVGGQTLPDLVTGGYAYYEANASNGVTPIGAGVVSTGVSGSAHGGGATAAGIRIPPLFTYEAWFVANNFANGATTIMGTEDNAYAVLIRLGDGGTPVVPNNQAQFVINNSKTNSTRQLVAGALYHAVATYDGITQRLYINGALDASLTATTAIPIGPIYMGFGTDAYAGANYGGYRTLPGTIPLARLWNRALSAAEVATLYTDPYAMFQAPRLIVPTGSGGGGAPPVTAAASTTLTAGALFSGSGTAAPVINAAASLMLAAGVLISGSGAAQPVIVNAGSVALAGGAPLAGSGAASPARMAATATTLTGGALLAGSGSALGSITGASSVTLSGGALLAGVGTSAPVVVPAASITLTGGALLTGSGAASGSLTNAGAVTVAGGALLAGSGVAQPVIVAALPAILTSGAVLSGAGAVGGVIPAGAATALGGVTLSGAGVSRPVVLTALPVTLTGGLSLSGSGVATLPPAPTTAAASTTLAGGALLAGSGLVAPAIVPANAVTLTGGAILSGIGAGGSVPVPVTQAAAVTLTSGLTHTGQGATPPAGLALLAYGAPWRQLSYAGVWRVLTYSYQMGASMPVTVSGDTSIDTLDQGVVASLTITAIPAGVTLGTPTLVDVLDEGLGSVSPAHMLAFVTGALTLTQTGTTAVLSYAVGQGATVPSDVGAEYTVVVRVPAGASSQVFRLPVQITNE